MQPRASRWPAPSGRPLNAPSVGRSSAGVTAGDVTKGIALENNPTSAQIAGRPSRTSPASSPTTGSRRERDRTSAWSVGSASATARAFPRIGGPTLERNLLPALTVGNPLLRSKHSSCTSGPTPGRCPTAASNARKTEETAWGDTDSGPQGARLEFSHSPPSILYQPVFRRVRFSHQ
uniref:Uncharacterized protein n=1 Tax=Otus sunia TaxID=257818 RepID=A0A8C8BBN5_9STRI